MPTINKIKSWLREAPVKRELRRRQDWTSRPGDAFYVRDANDCPIKVWLRRKGLLPPLADISKPRVLTLGQRGNWLEKEVLTALKEYNPLAKSDVPALRKSYASPAYDPPFVLSGKPDLIDWPDLYEIKSIGTKEFDETRSVDQARQSWHDQCNLYRDLFQVTECYLILVERNDARYRVFRVPEDPDRLRYLLRYFSELEDKIQSNVMPARTDCWKDCPCRSDDVPVEEDTSTD